MQDMRMDRESPLVTELSPDDPSFPLLSQRSASGARSSKSQHQTAPASAAASNSSSNPSQATSGQQQKQPVPNKSRTQSSSHQPEKPGKQANREMLEPAQPETTTKQQQADIRLPALSSAASSAVPSSGGSAWPLWPYSIRWLSSFPVGQLLKVISMPSVASEIEYLGGQLQICCD